MRQEGMQGKTVVLLCFLLGFGLAAILNLPSARYTEEPSIDMAAPTAMQPMRSTWQSVQPPKASQKHFLQPLARMGSLTTRASNHDEMKVKQKVEGAVLKAIP